MTRMVRCSYWWCCAWVGDLTEIGVHLFLKMQLGIDDPVSVLLLSPRCPLQWHCICQYGKGLRQSNLFIYSTYSSPHCAGSHWHQRLYWSWFLIPLLALSSLNFQSVRRPYCRVSLCPWERRKEECHRVKCECVHKFRCILFLPR